MVSSTSLLDTKLCTTPCYLQQALRFTVYCANSKCNTGVTNPPLVKYANIDPDNIPLTKILLSTRNTMTNHIVNSNTNRGRECWYRRMFRSGWPSAIALVDGDGSFYADKIFRDTIQLSSGHTWHNIRAQYLICFSNDASSLTKPTDLLTRFEHNSHISLLIVVDRPFWWDASCMYPIIK